MKYMVLKKITCIASLLFLVVSMQAKDDRVDSLLNVLDKTIQAEQEYDEQKELNLLALKRELTTSKTPESIHAVYYQLYKEYEAFIFDSAFYYARKHLELSEAENNSYWTNECKMQLARMYSIFASFSEAKDLLNSMDISDWKPEQSGAYFSSFAELYTYWSEYNSDDEFLRYGDLRNAYRDSALTVTPKGAYSYDINYGSKCIELRKFDEAEKTLLPYLSRVEHDTRDYAILTSIVARLYELKGQTNLQKEYLARSAIADIRASVKENISLGQLAYLMLNEDELNRANSYIRKSMEDANFYNAHLRNVRIFKVFPMIDTAFQNSREKYQRSLQLTNLIIALLSLFLAGIIFSLFRQMKKLVAARREVIQANQALQ